MLDIEQEENPTKFTDSVFQQARDRLEIDPIGLSVQPEDDQAGIGVRETGVHRLMRVERDDSGSPSEKDRAFFRLHGR